MAPISVDKNKRVLPFPNCLTMVAQIAAMVGPLVAPVFLAHSIGSEYSGDTWKMILPRHGSRLAFLITKLGIAVVGMILVLLVMTVVGSSIGWLGSTLIGLTPAPDETVVQVGDYALGIAVTVFPMLLYGSVALLVAIATRSALGGALVSFFGLQTIALLSPLYGRLAMVMPYPHVPNIIERWSFRDVETLNRVTQELGMPTSPLVSMGIVLAYCTAAVVGAGWVFVRRDMAGG